VNGFGTALRVKVFGSSHGPEVGAEISGLPAGLSVDLAQLQMDLDRRSPVGRRLATKRQEPDRLIVDSGVSDGVTDGSPFRGHVANVDRNRAPYDALASTPRPGHADFPARIRYGPGADLSGGGIFSGRMTVGLVLAGGLARQWLGGYGIRVAAFTRAIGGIDCPVDPGLSLAELARRAQGTETGCPEPELAARMEVAIADARRDGDSIGGIIEARAEGVPVGLGEPFFDSVESVVSHLAFSVPAVKGVEFGDGFRAALLRGSEHNDPYEWKEDRVVLRTNHAGGILGGLATGAPIVVRVAIKPTASIRRPQDTVDLSTRTAARIIVTGRHDPCIVPRAVVVVESVLAFALADLGLRGGFLK
jgi:chorismate synthase